MSNGLTPDSARWMITILERMPMSDLRTARAYQEMLALQKQMELAVAVTNSAHIPTATVELTNVQLHMIMNWYEHRRDALNGEPPYIERALFARLKKASGELLPCIRARMQSIAALAREPVSNMRAIRKKMWGNK